MYAQNKNGDVFFFNSGKEFESYQKNLQNNKIEPLTKMTEEQFIEFRDNRPKGGKWTVKGWVVDDDLLAQEIEAEKKAEADAIQTERSKLMQEMQYQMLIGNQEEAKEIALKIKELDENIKAL